MHIKLCSSVVIRDNFRPCQPKKIHLLKMHGVAYAQIQILHWLATYWTSIYLRFVISWTENFLKSFVNNKCLLSICNETGISSLRIWKARRQRMAYCCLQCNEEICNKFKWGILRSSQTCQWNEVSVLNLSCIFHFFVVDAWNIHALLLCSFTDTLTADDCWFFW